VATSILPSTENSEHGFTAHIVIANIKVSQIGDGKIDE